MQKVKNFFKKLTAPTIKTEVDLEVAQRERVIVPSKIEKTWESHRLQECLVPTYKYSGGKWAEVDVEEESVNYIEASDISFYTQNVWFDGYNMEERYNALVKIAEETDADFLCFQEVIGPFFQAITSSTKIQQNYYISGNKIHGYGVLMLSKYPCKFYEVQYANTGMSRSLLFAECLISPQSAPPTQAPSPLFIGTSHLESLGYPEIRREQLALVMEVLGKNAVFMGDFNFDYSWEGEKGNVDWEVYIDLWEALCSADEEKFTMFKTPKYDEVTFDHVIVGRKAEYEPEFVQRVGYFSCFRHADEHPTEVESDGVIRTPSDHLGLFGVIKAKSEA